MDVCMYNPDRCAAAAREGSKNGCLHARCVAARKHGRYGYVCTCGCDAVMPVRCGAVRVHSVGWFGGGNSVRAWAVRCMRDVYIEGEVGIGMGWRQGGSMYIESSAVRVLDRRPMFLSTHPSFLAYRFIPRNMTGTWFLLTLAPLGRWRSISSSGPGSRLLCTYVCTSLLM